MTAAPDPPGRRNVDHQHATWYPVLAEEAPVNKLAALTIVLSAAAAACVPAPKKAYSADEVKALDQIEEVMRVNAHTMDPLFSLEDQTTFDDATFTRLRDGGTKMQSTGAALQKPSIAGKFPEGFVTYAKQLAAQGEALSAAAEAKDGARASAALQAVHQACRDCHGEMR